MSQNLNKDEVIQALRKRLDTELKPGDKVVIEKGEDGFSISSEFHEVRSETIKAAVGSK